MLPNLLSAVPLLHVSSSEDAEAFYCAKLGFTKEWDYRPAAPASDPGYLGLTREGVTLHVSSFSGDGVAGGVVTFYVRGLDALFAEFQSRGVPIELEPYDQTWGNREMYVRDADGNSLRFVQTKSAPLA
jgi:catechol 2,3-dioxygenase-like lactoylglutathione lyase family enzyme